MIIFWIDENESLFYWHHYHISLLAYHTTCFWLQKVFRVLCRVPRVAQRCRGTCNVGIILNSCSTATIISRLECRIGEWFQCEMEFHTLEKAKRHECRRCCPAVFCSRVHTPWPELQPLIWPACNSAPATIVRLGSPKHQPLLARRRHFRFPSLLTFWALGTEKWPNFTFLLPFELHIKLQNAKKQISSLPRVPHILHFGPLYTGQSWDTARNILVAALRHGLRPFSVPWTILQTIFTVFRTNYGQTAPLFRTDALLDALVSISCTHFTCATVALPVPVHSASFYTRVAPACISRQERCLWLSRCSP